jgi:hypothetical protein
MSEANKTQVGGGHYKGQPIEHWDFVLMHNIPYMEAQIIKYAMRWRSKGGLDDLRKARHFIDKLIEVELTQEVDAARTPQATLEETRAAIQGSEEDVNTYMNPDSGVPRGKGYVNQD